MNEKINFINQIAMSICILMTATILMIVVYVAYAEVKMKLREFNREEICK